MASNAGSVYYSSDLVKGYVCDACESKQIEESADTFCATCKKFFCGKCIYQHDKLYANHSKYGREETNQWPLTKTMGDWLLKCDVHKEKKLEMFCHDHSQLCCTDCVLLNHRQCINVTAICESVKNISFDMHQLSINLQTMLDELHTFKSTQEANILSVELSYSENLQDIQDLRKKFNAALDALENTTLKELDVIRTNLQTSLKEDVDNCSRLHNELKQLREAVHVLCGKSKKEIEFIASKKCLYKIQESRTYLKKNPVNSQRTIIFKAKSHIGKYLSQQSSLGMIIDSMQSLAVEMNPDQVMTAKRTLEYIVRISEDTYQTYRINGICCLSTGQVIITDYRYNKVNLLAPLYNTAFYVSSQCDVPGPFNICQITSNEVAVTVNANRDVQFISVINGQLVNGRKFQLPHSVSCICHHEGALYFTSGTALYHFTLNESLVEKLYEDTGGSNTVWQCAVSPAGDIIYVTNKDKHKLITLSTDGTLISTFTDPELYAPSGVHVTPSGQVLVCGQGSHTIIQVDHEGRKKLATLVSKKDRLRQPVLVCYNTKLHQIIVVINDGAWHKIHVIELQ